MPGGDFYLHIRTAPLIKSIGIYIKRFFGSFSISLRRSILFMIIKQSACARSASRTEKIVIASAHELACKFINA